MTYLIPERVDPDFGESAQTFGPGRSYFDRVLEWWVPIERLSRVPAMWSASYRSCLGRMIHLLNRGRLSRIQSRGLG